MQKSQNSTETIAPLDSSGQLEEQRGEHVEDSQNAMHLSIAAQTTSSSSLMTRLCSLCGRQLWRDAASASRIVVSPAPEIRTPTLTLLLAGNDPLQVSAEPLSGVLLWKYALNDLDILCHLVVSRLLPRTRHALSISLLFHPEIRVDPPFSSSPPGVASVRCQCFCSEQSRMEIHS
ncbi:hypothetical protein AOLI_G00052630 [Acnodon oligacanthus]